MPIGSPHMVKRNEAGTHPAVSFYPSCAASPGRLLKNIVCPQLNVATLRQASATGTNTIRLRLTPPTGRCREMPYGGLQAWKASVFPPNPRNPRSFYSFSSFDSRPRMRSPAHGASQFFPGTQPPHCVTTAKIAPQSQLPLARGGLHPAGTQGLLVFS